MVGMVSGGGTTASAVGDSRSLAAPEQTWFSTDSVPPGRRVTEWETHHASMLVGLRTRLGTGTQLRAQTATLRLPRIRVAKVNGSPHSVQRTAEDVATHPVSGVVVYIPLQGMNEFNHRTGSLTVGPRRGLICDGDTAFSRTFPQGVSELVIQLPRETLAQLTDADSVRRPIPLDLDPDNALNLAARELTQLAAGALDRGLRHGQRLETRLLDLLTGVLSRPLAKFRAVAGGDGRDRRSTLRSQAQRRSSRPVRRRLRTPTLPIILHHWQQRPADHSRNSPDHSSPHARRPHLGQRTDDRDRLSVRVRLASPALARLSSTLRNRATASPKPAARQIGVAAAGIEMAVLSTPELLSRLPNSSRPNSLYHPRHNPGRLRPERTR